MRFDSQREMVALYSLSLILVLFSISVIAYQYVAALGSLEEVIKAMGEYRVLSALWLSITSSVAATILAVIFGVPLAYVFATKEFKWKTLVETLVIDIPQTFPPIAEGIILLLLLGPYSPIGINLAFTFSALVVAKLYIAGPFVVSFVARKFTEIRKSGISITAATLGANQFQVFSTVFLPLSRREIVAGAGMCWARAMGELGGSLIFAGVIIGQTETIPTFVATNSQNLLIPSLAASLLATTASTLALITFRRMMKKGE